MFCFLLLLLLPPPLSLPQSKSNESPLDANLPLKTPGWENNQEGDSGQLEHVCWQPGDQLRGRFNKKARRALMRAQKLVCVNISQFFLFFKHFFLRFVTVDPAHPRPPRNTNPFRLSMHLHTVYVNTDDADDPTHTVHSILFTCPFDFFFIF